MQQYQSLKEKYEREYQLAQYFRATGITEEWKDIPNFEGKYQISNLGRVRSLQSYYGYIRRLQPTCDFTYGWKVTLRNPITKKSILIKVSKLVVCTFYDLEDCVLQAHSLKIIYIDGNKHNCNLSNLSFSIRKTSNLTINNS